MVVAREMRVEVAGEAELLVVMEEALVLLVMGQVLLTQPPG